jgi:hypothetical protein
MNVMDLLELRRQFLLELRIKFMGIAKFIYTGLTL